MWDRAIGRSIQFLFTPLTSLQSASHSFAQVASLSLALGFTPGCDRGGDRDTPRIAPARTAAESPRLGASELEALRSEAKRQLMEELRPEVVSELRRTLAPEVKAQLLAEARAHGATPRPDATAGHAEVDGGPNAPSPDAAAPSPAAVAAPAGDDIWTTPGTRIWPSAGGLKLVELVVGSALEEKLPTEVKLHYATTPEILYCYSVFENPLPDATVTHVWRRGSRLVSRVELEVGRSPKWRTWSKQRTQPHWTGLWSCEVLGPDGQQLGLTVFQIGG